MRKNILIFILLLSFLACEKEPTVDDTMKEGQICGSTFNPNEWQEVSSGFGHGSQSNGFALGKFNEDDWSADAAFEKMELDSNFAYLYLTTFDTLNFPREYYEWYFLPLEVGSYPLAQVSDGLELEDSDTTYFGLALCAPFFEGCQFEFSLMEIPSNNDLITVDSVSPAKDKIWARFNISMYHCVDNTFFDLSEGYIEASLIE